MLIFVKKLVDLVFMKKDTPNYLYSIRVDQELINSIFMDDLTFGGDDTYQDTKPRYDPTCFEHNDDFEKVPSYGHPRVCSIATDSDAVKENNKGNFIRDILYYALHGLEKSRYILSIATKVLNKSYSNKETKNEPKEVNKNDNKNDYGSFNKTIDQGEHCQIALKTKETCEEDFELVENSPEVTKQQEHGEINNEEEFDILSDAIDQEYHLEIVPKIQGTHEEDFELIESAEDVAKQQECDEIDDDEEYDFCDKAIDRQVVYKKQENQEQKIGLVKHSEKAIIHQKGNPIDNLIKEYACLYPTEVGILDFSKLKRYR